MHATCDTHRIRLWRDWLLLAVGLVALCIPLDLAADAAYRRDHTVLYWFLIIYSYPAGTLAATVIGLAVLASALLAYWLSLRLLARAGLSPVRTIAALVLTALGSVSAALTLLLAFLLWGSGSLISGAITLGLAFLTVALAFGLRAIVGVSHEREPGTRRAWLTLLRPLALIAVATLLALAVTPAALLIGERPTTYSHLASASFQSHRYYLALEQTPSDGFHVLLYRCDALGMWCREADTLSTADNGQGENGSLRYDPATQTLTASEGQHLLLTYPARDLFEGP